VARALPHLAYCRGVRVVFEDSGQLQLVGQSGSETKSIQTCDVGRLHHQALIYIHRTRNDHRYRPNAIAIGLTLRFTLAHGLHERPDDLIRICGVRRFLLKTKMDLSVFVNRGGTQMCPAEIGSKYHFTAGSGSA